mmetsp:Transcript_113514/g.244388  ORF Transcript_113514/g.244388 Transcript_113514/m.244388 type:complete len:334 (-) Transcript_113514:561-1562(-)
MVGAPDRRRPEVLLPRGDADVHVGEAGDADDCGGALQRHPMARVQDLGRPRLLLQQGDEGQLLEHASRAEENARRELRRGRPAPRADAGREDESLPGAAEREGRQRQLDVEQGRRGHAGRIGLRGALGALQEALLRRAPERRAEELPARGAREGAQRGQGPRPPHRGALRPPRRPRHHVRGLHQAPRWGGVLGALQVGRPPGGGLPGDHGEARGEAPEGADGAARRARRSAAAPHRLGPRAEAAAAPLEGRVRRPRAPRRAAGGGPASGGAAGLGLAAGTQASGGAPGGVPDEGAHQGRRDRAPGREEAPRQLRGVHQGAGDPGQSHGRVLLG